MLNHQYDFQDESYIPCIFINNATTLVTCWCIPDGKESQLLKTNEGDLVCFPSILELEKSEDINNQVDVFYDAIRYYNINKFFLCLNKIKPYVQLSTDDCDLILEELNILEDVLYTLNISNQDYKLPRMKSILDKLFWGCNLPSMDHPEYHPSFKPYDIKILKRVSHNTWRKIIKKEPMFK